MAKTNIPDGKTKISINIPERLLIELYQSLKISIPKYGNQLR